jgi:hypothetical protein
MVRSLKLLGAITGIALLGVSSASAQVQTSAQQKCINAMNKNGSKLNDAQCIDNRACIKDFGQERLTTTAEVCLTDDRLGKIAKRELKTDAHETSFCTTPAVVPAFAKENTATVNAAAKQASIDMLHDIFGNPIDGGLFVCDTHPNHCYCQRFMSKWIADFNDAARVPQV